MLFLLTHFIQWQTKVHRQSVLFLYDLWHLWTGSWPKYICPNNTNSCSCGHFSIPLTFSNNWQLKEKWCGQLQFGNSVWVETVKVLNHPHPYGLLRSISYASVRCGFSWCTCKPKTLELFFLSLQEAKKGAKYWSIWCMELNKVKRLWEVAAHVVQPLEAGKVTWFAPKYVSYLKCVQDWICVNMLT